MNAGFPASSGGSCCSAEVNRKVGSEQSGIGIVHGDLYGILSAEGSVE